jgi:hypothetical protein
MFHLFIKPKAFAKSNSQATFQISIDERDNSLTKLIPTRRSIAFDSAVFFSSFLVSQNFGSPILERSRMMNPESLSTPS